MANIAIEIAEGHLVYGSKEPFDATATLRLTRYREHESDLEVIDNLLQMPGGEVGAIICVEDAGNTANLPVGMPFAPYSLAQSR